ARGVGDYRPQNSGQEVARQEARCQKGRSEKAGCQEVCSKESAREKDGCEESSLQGRCEENSREKTRSPPEEEVAAARKGKARRSREARQEVRRSQKVTGGSERLELEGGEHGLADDGAAPALKDRYVAATFGELLDIAAGGEDLRAEAEVL